MKNKLINNQRNANLKLLFFVQMQFHRSGLMKKMYLPEVVVYMFLKDQLIQDKRVHVRTFTVCLSVRSTSSRSSCVRYFMLILL